MGKKDKHELSFLTTKDLINRYSSTWREIATDNLRICQFCHCSFFYFLGYKVEVQQEKLLIWI